MSTTNPPTDVNADLGTQLAVLSAWIDATPSNATRDREARLWGRVAKVSEEAGEAIAALIGVTGQNPRKGVTHTISDLRTELLDVAVSALAAVEHLNGNDATSIQALTAHLTRLVERAGLGTTADAEAVSIEAVCEVPDGGFLVLSARIAHIRLRHNRNQDPWAVLTLTDQAGDVIDVNVYPQRYPAVRALLELGRTVTVAGLLSRRNTKPTPEVAIHAWSITAAADAHPAHPAHLLDQGGTGVLAGSSHHVPVAVGLLDLFASSELEAS